MRREIFIDVETGEVVTLDSPETAALLADCEPTSKRRASHVEPVSRPLRLVFHVLRRIFGEVGRVGNWTRSSFFAPWRVNLAPVNGPVLPASFTDRQEAIAAEVDWLNAHPENWI